MPHRKVKPARESTDTRLGTERSKTDDELAARVRASYRQADEVLHVDRARAEEVLRTARARADERSERSQVSPVEETAIAAERARDDEVLRQEHARADEITAAERVERARLVASLLDRERRDTDAGLLLERVTADEVLSQREHFLGMVSHEPTASSPLASFAASRSRSCPGTPGRSRCCRPGVSPHTWSRDGRWWPSMSFAPPLAVLEPRSRA